MAKVTYSFRKKDKKTKKIKPVVNYLLIKLTIKGKSPRDAILKASHEIWEQAQFTTIEFCQAYLFRHFEAYEVKDTI